jgi:hypothetical protein
MMTTEWINARSKPMRSQFMNKPVIHFGKRSYRIEFAKWDSERHIGLIQVYDDEGNAFIVESDGLAANEQRQAVANFVLRQAAA